jgi:hypothetical protein
MKKFTIKKTDDIKIHIRNKDGLFLTRSIFESGFSKISEAKSYAMNFLPWDYKGYGRRIEISIHNLDSGESKYINTFS